LVRDIFSPLYVFPFPIILWAGLNVAGPANLLLFWNLTESAVLSNSLYNWSPGAVGYSNFAFVIGGMLGLVTAGPFSNWVAKQMTKRNNGVREAEMRLPALIPYFITTTMGIVVGGLAYERLWKWQLILVFGIWPNRPLRHHRSHNRHRVRRRLLQTNCRRDHGRHHSPEKTLAGLQWATGYHLLRRVRGFSLQRWSSSH
jgi:hypothetical protein